MNHDKEQEGRIYEFIGKENELMPHLDKYRRSFIEATINYFDISFEERNIHKILKRLEGLTEEQSILVIFASRRIFLVFIGFSISNKDRLLRKLENEEAYLLTSKTTQITIYYISDHNALLAIILKALSKEEKLKELGYEGKHPIIELGKKIGSSAKNFINKFLTNER